MAIVFDEVKYAEEIEREEISTSYNAIKKGAILAKLYFNRGMTEKQVIDELNKKFTILDCSYNYNIKYIKIKKMLELAKNSKPMESKNIKFSNKELNFIHSINNAKIEKVFFVMLCISKFYNNSFYFKDREIFELAEIPWKGQTSQEIFGYLIRNGYFTVEEKPLLNNKSIRKLFYSATDCVLDLYDDSDIAFEICDYRRLANRYMSHFYPSDYIVCKRCGCIEVKNSNSQVYCKTCAVKSKNDSNMRHIRNKRQLVGR